MNFLTKLASRFLLPLVMLSCVNGTQIKPLEEMTADKFQLLCESTKQASKLTIGILIRHGELTREAAMKIASDIEVVTADPLTVTGPNFITDALKKAGLSQPDALDALETVELFLRLRYDIGSAGLPLTKRTVALATAVVDGIRMATVVQLTPEDLQAVEDLKKEVSAAK